MRDIAKNIKQLRIRKNMTQDELAEKLFVTRQTVSNYETGKSCPDVDMLVKIAEVTDTDIHQVIYGPEPTAINSDQRRLIVGAALTILFGLCYGILTPIAKEGYYNFSIGGWYILLLCFVRPLFCLFLGWTLSHLIGMALKRKPLNHDRLKWIRIVLVTAVTLWIILSIWYHGAVILNDYLYANHIRGEWVEVEGTGVLSPAWSMLEPPIPDWLASFGGFFLFPFSIQNPLIFLLLGSILWVFGFPKSIKE